MKKRFILKIVAISVLATLIILFAGYKMVEATGKYPFCGSCHAWDGAIAQTNLADPIHGGSNPKGLGIKCTDCHLPHGNIVEYILVKAKNGISEGFTTLTKDPTKKDWIKNRPYARKHYTFDSSCLRCHNDVIKSSDANATRHISQMHKKYLEFKGTANELKCTDCHKFVGHKDLGKMLIEQKDKTPNSWDEWVKEYEKSKKSNTPK